MVGVLPFGTIGKQRVDLITITHPDGSYAKFTDYGARLVALGIPDAHGKIADVVTGYNSLEGYLKGARFFGANVGPYANRIGGARFAIDGLTYLFVPNGNGNLLHSGERGFDSVVWAHECADNSVEFRHLSPDSEFDFPGDVDVRIKYEFTTSHALRISYLATTTKPTHLNIAHHSYFNLAGHERGLIDYHEVQIIAQQVLETDADLIATGKFLRVENTPLDLRQYAWIGAREFDHCYAIDDYDGSLRAVARVRHQASGRTMQVYSTLPGLQFYTANHPVPGKDGAQYPARTSFCLEPQFFPNTPNIAHFPSSLLRPGEIYKHTVEYRFSDNIVDMSDKLKLP